MKRRFQGIGFIFSTPTRAKAMGASRQTDWNDLIATVLENRK